jgi:CRP-like cAMP-binding protein
MVELGELMAFREGEDGAKLDVLAYGPGAYFGELAMLEDRPRQATVECVADSRLLLVDRDSFTRMLGSEVI